MKRRVSAVALCLMLVGLPHAARARDKSISVREQRTLVVRGTREIWQLVWMGKTFPACPPDEMYVSITMPCHGVAYGEYGNLWIVRKRHGREIERIDLTSLFGHFDFPDGKMRGKAFLQRWPFERSDVDRDGTAFVAEVKRRPPSTIMTFADYDRDGRATEFLIQVGTLGGGVQLFAAVGVSVRNPRLHALSSVEKPDVPIEMQLRPWNALRTATRPTRLTTWQCDDHDSDVQQDLIVWAQSGKIHFKELFLHCPVGAQAKPRR